MSTNSSDKTIFGEKLTLSNIRSFCQHFISKLGNSSSQNPVKGFLFEMLLGKNLLACSCFIFKIILFLFALWKVKINEKTKLTEVGDLNRLNIVLKAYTEGVIFNLQLKHAIGQHESQLWIYLLTLWEALCS